MTTKITHTPGPWHIETIPEMHLTVINCHDASGCASPIASINRGQEAHEANARLIAAAPDMRAALKAVVNHKRPGGVEKNGLYVRIAMPAYDRIKAVITRAEGRRP